MTEDLVKKAKDDFSDEECDELGRSLDKLIDLNEVEITSPSKKGRQAKPLISAEEAGQIIEKQKREDENE